MQPVTVVKCGGNAAVHAGRVCADVAALAHEGHRVVLAHGGSAEIDRLAGLFGVPQRRLVCSDGMATRYTDEATLEVVTIALAGSVKPRLVVELARHDVCAVGLTGLDGGLLRARRRRVRKAGANGRRVLVHDDHSGHIVSVNSALLNGLFDAGSVPVISPPALDEDGFPVNVDGDRAAAAVAVALRATTLVLLTGAPGVLRDPDDESSVLQSCRVPLQGPLGIRARGGMAPKLMAAREALRAGLPRVLIADGRLEHPLRRALEGEGSTVLLERRRAMVMAG